LNHEKGVFAMTERKTIHTDSAPQAIGPYSQAQQVGNLLYTSGQIPLLPDGTLSGEDVQTQTRQVLNNVQAVVEAAGSGLEHVVKVTIFIKNMDDFASINDIYAEYFGQTKPARSCVEVARLPKDVLVEMECIALVP
jgi:2-iminobutanoate/2-iminopropanoate deaminase